MDTAERIRRELERHPSTHHVPEYLDAAHRGAVLVRPTEFALEDRAKYQDAETLTWGAVLVEITDPKGKVKAEVFRPNWSRWGKATVEAWLEGDPERKREQSGRMYCRIARMIHLHLVKESVQVGDTFDRAINQGTRDCEIVAIKRTRARIEYEMPNAGMMGGWIPGLWWAGEFILTDQD
jgi:hypothetical protein